jgi:hypothetical protein
MKWNYKKEVNRMGEVTQTLTNESIDMPVLDEYKTPTLIIKKDRFGFGIKFYLGGLELKGGYKVETYYTIGCYNTYIEHHRLVSQNGIRKYRFRFDEGQVEESNIDYFCKDESEFKIVSDFMFNLKESKRFIVELDTLTHGIQYYEFEIEGLTELCDEHNIFQYKKPTPFEPFVPTPAKNNYGWQIFISCIIFCLFIWFISKNEVQPKQTTSNEIHYDTTLNYDYFYNIRTIVNLSYNPPTKEKLNEIITSSLHEAKFHSLIEKVCVYESTNHKQIEVRVDYGISYNEPSEHFYYDTYTYENIKKEKQKEEVKKKVKAPKIEKIVKEEYTNNEDEYVKSINNTPTYNENEMEMIRYLKTKFPNYTEDQIGRIVKKSNVSYSTNNEQEDIPTYTAVSYKKSEGYYNYKEKENYTEKEEQPKKKGFIKRLFGKK